MTAIAAFVRVVYGLNRWVGRLGAVLILASVLICAFVAFARYFLGFGKIWVQELYVVAFGVSFMLIAAYAYANNTHVRVDILQRSWPPRRKAAVEIVGVVLFLLPWLAFIAWSSVPFIRLSWGVLEPSPQPGGLQGFFIVKTVIPVFVVLLALQGLARIGVSILVLRGRLDLLPREEVEPHAELPGT